MLSKQISVFLENHGGALCELTGVLGDAGVDFMALSVADTANFGIVRCIVKEVDIEKATAVLSQKGYTSRVSHVLCVCVPNRPAGLYEVLSILQEDGVSVEYMYSFFRPTAQKALLILRLSDNKRGAELFLQKGVEIVGQEEINQL